MSTGPRDPSDDPVRSLLRASHHLRADQMGTVVAEHARDLGARDAVIYLADYEQKDLVADHMSLFLMIPASPSAGSR